MSGRRAVSLDSLPLYASDEQIGAAILGTGRAQEWCCLALALEKQPSFPLVDKLHGGRYVPAVKRFYDLRHGLLNSTNAATPPPARERLDLWTEPKKRRA